MSRVNELGGWRTVGHRLARPGTILVMLALVTFAALELGNRLEAVRHPDTSSYLRSAVELSGVDVLSHYRSFGYPLFLRIVGATGLSREAVPEVQTALYFAAAIFLFAALGRWSRSPWLAFAAAAPLLWAPIAAQSGLIQPDLLAAALTLAAIACLLLLAAGRRSPLVWAGFALAVFGAYFVRPANLFLILWAPAIGWLLRVAREGRPTRRAVVWTGRLACLTLVPFLAFATLRWALVDHFGLVPFGGVNLSAVTANLLDAEVLQSLPNEERRLGRGIYRTRKERGWEPLVPGGNTRLWFEQYNDTLWRINYPSAWERLRREREEGAGPDRPDHVVVNERLSRLAKATIVRRPLLYLQWVRDASLYGLEQLDDYAWIRWPLVLLVLAAMLAWLAGIPGGTLAGARLPFTFVALASSYLLLQLLLVSMVSFPFLRYMRSITLLLPSALCVLLWEAGRLWVAGLRSGWGGTD